MSVDWSTQEAWDAVYQIRDRTGAGNTPGAYLGYSRDAMVSLVDPDSPNLELFEHRRDNLIRDFGMTTGESILIAGGAFGYLCEAFLDLGFTRCYTLDDSAYITGLPGETRADVLTRFIEVDMTTGFPQLRGAIRAVTREVEGNPGYSQFDWVITEDVLTSYATNEVDPVLNAAEAVLDGADLARCVHMVTEDPVPAPFTSLTLEAWDALRAAHSWVSIRLSQWRVL